MLGEFDFEVEYRPGYKHGNADPCRVELPFSSVLSTTYGV